MIIKILKYFLRIYNKVLEFQAKTSTSQSIMPTIQTSDGCALCGRVNHNASKCFATKSVTKKVLPNPPPCQPPSLKKKVTGKFMLPNAAPQGPFMPQQQGPFMPQQQGQFMPHQQGQFMPHQQGQFMPHQQGQFMPQTPALTPPVKKFSKEDLEHQVCKYVSSITSARCGGRKVDGSLYCTDHSCGVGVCTSSKRTNHAACEKCLVAVVANNLYAGPGGPA